MTCQITLGPNDDFELILPSGRRLYVPIENGTKYLAKILADARREGKAQRLGYIASFPTQHVVDKWVKEELVAKRKAQAEAALQERREKIKSTLGIDLASLEIEL